MGYAVQVDPDMLAVSARRLLAAGETLDVLAGHVAALCAGAGAAVGEGELSTALAEVARETARAVGQGAQVVGALGTGTALAGDDYRLLEQAMTSRLGLPGGLR